MDQSGAVQILQIHITHAWNIVENDMGKTTLLLHQRLVRISAYSMCRQEKTQVQLPGASKFCRWANENGSLVSENNLS